MRKGRLAVVLAALASTSVLLLAEDKKGPKKPDRPFNLAITTPKRPAPTTDDEIKAAKEVSDTLADIEANVRDKRKDWFVLASNPEDAEIILEVDGRAREYGHGAVLHGLAYVLNLKPFPILGQGALQRSGSFGFGDWRDAAGNMIQRLQVVCQAEYDDISAARKKGLKPLAVLQNDRGLGALAAGKTDEAIADFNEAIRIAPSLAKAHANRGIAYSRGKDFEKAVADFDEALRLEPGYPKASLYRGESNQRRGMLEAAKADYDAAIRLDPKSVDAYLARAGVLQPLGDARGAIADLDKAMALGAAKADALAQRAISHATLGQKDEALADYDAAIAAGARQMWLYYNRGLLLKEHNDPKACESFETAASLDRSDPSALFERGLCEAKSGRDDAAIADFTEVIRQRPDKAEAYWNRAICYGKQKKTRAAADDRAKALKLKPELAKKA
jgi:tetratricopeptide (TPR) repeat protein